MKKALALLIILVMLPMSRALAADTPNSESSTGAIGGSSTGPVEEESQGEETEHEDSLRKMYNSFREMDDAQWQDTMQNKDLYGCNNENGDFELTGLLNELFFNVEDMMPGDTVTKYMRIKNTSNMDYRLYFKAKRDKAPDEGEVDLFDVLDLEITKTGKTLEDVVYKGKIFDGDMKNQTFDLGTMKSNQEAVILRATVTMDPNAGNEYKNKSAQVDWIFRAEGDDPENPDEPDNPDKPDNPDNPENPMVPVNKKDIVSNDVNDAGTIDLADYSGKGLYKGTVSKTGDKNYLVIYFLLACGSLLTGYVLFSKGKKNRKEH